MIPYMNPMAYRYVNDLLEILKFESRNQLLIVLFLLTCLFVCSSSGPGAFE